MAVTAATYKTNRDEPSLGLFTMDTFFFWPFLGIDALSGFIGKGFDQRQVRIEEMVRGAEDITASGPSRIKAATDFLSSLIGVATGEKMELVKTSDHAYLVADPLFRFGQIDV